MLFRYVSESYSTNPEPISVNVHIRQLFRNYAIVLKDKLFIVYVLAGVLILSIELHLVNYTGIRLSNEMPTQTFFQWELNGSTMMGLLRSENTILVVLFALLASKISSGNKDRQTLIWSCLLFTIPFGFMNYFTNIWLLFLLMFLLTIGEVVRVPIDQSYMASLPTSELRSSYMSLAGMKYNLAMLVASVTVMLGAYLSSLIMAILITATGLVGTLLYLLIGKNLDERVALESNQIAG
nr:hypothetical protein [Fictibacillus macauensis]